MTSTDREAAVRARFEAMWESHHRDVFAYAYRRLGDEHAASDAAAEAFLVAWRRFDRVPGSPLPWLLAVARRVVANQRRAQTRRDALFTRLVGEWGSGRQPAEDEASGEVSLAFDQLRSEDREVLSLIAWEGLKPREAAIVLGISSARFSVRLHRARRRLRSRIESEGDERDDHDEASAGRTPSTVGMEIR